MTFLQVRVIIIPVCRNKVYKNKMLCQNKETSENKSIFPFFLKAVLATMLV